MPTYTVYAVNLMDEPKLRLIGNGFSQVPLPGDSLLVKTSDGTLLETVVVHRNFDTRPSRQTVAVYILKKGERPYEIASKVRRGELFFDLPASIYV